MNLKNGKMKKGLFFLSSLFMLVFFSCGPCNPPLPDQYELAVEHGLDGYELWNVYEKANETEGLKSLLISRNGVLLTEEYFTEMGADDLYQVRSVTKSVVSTLIGIAIEEGFITGVSQKLSDFLTPLGYSLDGDEANITIEHLLTMSSGYHWNEFSEEYEYNDWVLSSDQIEYCINGKLENKPGEVFRYSNEASHLLSVILTEATGMSTHDFAFEYLFRPLGMSDQDFGWAAFGQGYFNGAADLVLKPKDMMKIGNLFLNNGKYNDNQIVPSNWVEESTQKQINSDYAVGYGPSYGYLWWVNNDMQYDFYFANGYGGQFIVVYPALELVVVATSEYRGGIDDAGPRWYGVLSLIVNDVINCVK